MYKKVIDEIRRREYSQDDVQEAARQIYSVSQAGIPVKIIEICQNIGFSIFQQSLPKDICGYIMIDGELKERFRTDRIISVNEGESNKRRRFTVAHELGHFLFDFKPNAAISFTEMEYEQNDGSRPAEIRANRFAAELLMPAEEFEKEYRAAQEKYNGSCGRLYETVQELSDRFLVPPRAVERRIREELKLQ